MNTFLFIIHLFYLLIYLFYFIFTIIILNTLLILLNTFILILLKFITTMYPININDYIYIYLMIYWDTSNIYYYFIIYNYC